MIFSQKNMHAKNFAYRGPYNHILLAPTVYSIISCLIFQVPSLSKRRQITNIFVKRKKNKKILDNIF